MLNIGEILKASTVSDVTSLLERLSEHRQLAWKPVGSRSNNLATINIGSDPAAGLTERITNAIDAVLEREWEERGQPTHVRSPREAVEEWFSLPKGRLAEVEARDPAISELSRRIQVSLLGSGSDNHPTVDIRDHGIGLRAEDFHGSILGLNENLKVDKFFLAGAFGQGGSTALSYSVYTLVVSRRADKSNGSDSIAFTLVRFNERDLAKDKHGLYEYLVDHRTGHPFELSADGEEFSPGTLVRHVHTDIGKYHRLLTAPTNSLWYLTHHYLFDPVLPFRIEEQRDNASRGENRFVGGNHRRLHQGERGGEDEGTVEYQRSAQITFRQGLVSVHWWVLTAGQDLSKSRDRITNYVLPSKPIVITFNGQKQGDLPNTVIKNDLRLPYLERYLIVQVDCDKLDSASRRQLFSTTRESLRDGGLLDDLRSSIVDVLSADDDLRRLDQLRKQRYLQRTDDASTEHLRRRLANRLRTYMRAGGGRSTGPGTPPDRPPGPGTEKRPSIPVQEPPSLLEITTESPKDVHIGKTFRVLFKTDAAPEYFASADSFMPIVTPPSIGQFTGTTSVRDGYGIAYFKVSDGAEVGDAASITLELRPTRARTLSSSLEVQVVELPEEPTGGARDSSTPNLRIVPVDRHHAYFIDHGWNEHSVASAEESESETIVYVSVENSRLNELVTRAQRKGSGAVEAIKGFYTEHVAFHTLLLELRGAANGDVLDEEEAGEPLDSAALDRFKDYELRRACETVCGIIDATFDLIVTSGTTAADEA